MKYIQLELQLDEVNTRISELLEEKNSHWTEIAKLAIIVQKQELFKPKFTSFTAWVKDIAVQCDRQPSLIWRYIKASRYYLQLIDAVEVGGEDEDEDLDLARLTEIKAAPEALERLEKVQRQAPTPVFETLRDKVLNGKATVAECREIEKAYRPSMIQTAAEAAQSQQPLTSNSQTQSEEESTLTESESESESEELQTEPLVLPIPMTNRGRPKKGQEGSYGHLGQNKNKIVTEDGSDNGSDGEADEVVRLRLDNGELARNKIAPTIMRSLTVNLVDWTKTIASRNYAAKYYQDHTEVRVNFQRQRYRLDFLAVVRWTFKRPKDIFVVEVKSCLQDFESDHKWTNYLNFCDYFCFAIPLEDVELLAAVKKITDDRIGILGIDFQASIDEFCSYPVTVIKKPKKLDNQKHYGNHTHLVYETLYERVLGWKEKDDD